MATRVQAPKERDASVERADRHQTVGKTAAARRAPDDSASRAGIDPRARLARADRLGHSATDFSIRTNSSGSGGNGKPLPNTVRAKFERSFGADLSNLRVHVGGHVRAIGARAFAQGSDLHFEPGAYRPESSEGQRLIGHEVAHALQQRAGRVQAARGFAMPVNTDQSLEAEAHQAGSQAARGESAPLSVGGAAGLTARAGTPPAAVAPIQGVWVYHPVHKKLVQAKQAAPGVYEYDGQYHHAGPNVPHPTNGNTYPSLGAAANLPAPPAGGKSFQVYEKFDATSATLYIGRTSGAGTVNQNVQRRDARHHVQGNYGAAAPIFSSNNPYSGRGAEEMIMQYRGGVPNTGNKIAGISQNNPRRNAYIHAFQDENRGYFPLNAPGQARRY